MRAMEPSQFYGTFNVKSNLFNNFSTSERQTELSINDNEEMVNTSGYNDHMNGTKETLVTKLTSADETQILNKRKKWTKRHIIKSIKKLHRDHIKIINKTEYEEHKATHGSTEEQSEINKDLEYKEVAKKIIIKSNYEDTKCTFTTENNGHKTIDCKKKGTVNEENCKIQEFNE